MKYIALFLIIGSLFLTSCATDDEMIINEECESLILYENIAGSWTVTNSNLNTSGVIEFIPHGNLVGKGRYLDPNGMLLVDPTRYDSTQYDAGASTIKILGFNTEFGAVRSRLDWEITVISLDCRELSIAATGVKIFRN